MFLNPFKRHGDDPYALLVGMTGVKLGDRLIQLGCAHGARMAAVAAKVGLSGRTVLVAPDAESAARAEKGARDAGVLVEVETVSPRALPLDPEAFDIAIIDDTGGLLAAMNADARVMACRELLRVLRPAGRVMTIGAGARHGLGALIARAPEGPPFDAIPPLEEAGFRAVRKLAEREGLVFVEGIKPRTPA